MTKKQSVAKEAGAPVVTEAVIVLGLEEAGMLERKALAAGYGSLREYLGIAAVDGSAFPVRVVGDGEVPVRGRVVRKRSGGA